MQQERGSGGDHQEKLKQNQPDRRLVTMMQQQGDQNQQQQQEQQQQQQPQKCPRCESLNTKFCYYNNYSLSQPRYFCKTCRRYWTQGGTLRNVPVGGGCRKGKRTKISSSSTSSSSSATEINPLRSQSLQQNLTNTTSPQTMISSNNSVITSSSGVINHAALRAKEAAGNLVGSYYPSGGFLSSLAAIQSLNPSAAAQGFNHQLLSVGGDHLGGSSISNLGLLQGYNVNDPLFGSELQHHQIHQQPQFYQMGNSNTANREKIVMNPVYSSDHDQILIRSSRPTGFSHHHQHQQQQQQQNWHQSFMNSGANNPTDHAAALWSTMSINNSSTRTTSGNTNNSNSTPVGSPSLNPNQWPDLPAGYPPPR